MTDIARMAHFMAWALAVMLWVAVVSLAVIVQGVVGVIAWALQQGNEALGTLVAASFRVLMALAPRKPTPAVEAVINRVGGSRDS